MIVVDRLSTPGRSSNFNSRREVGRHSASLLLEGVSMGAVSTGAVGATIRHLHLVRRFASSDLISALVVMRGAADTALVIEQEFGVGVRAVVGATGGVIFVEHTEIVA